MVTLKAVAQLFCGVRREAAVVEICTCSTSYSAARAFTDFACNFIAGSGRYTALGCSQGEITTEPLRRLARQHTFTK